MAEMDFMPSVGDVLDSLIPKNADEIAAPQFITASVRHKIRVYYLGLDKSERIRRVMMTAMTLAGRCEDTRPDSWQTWVLTWSILCFPELLTTMKNDNNCVDYSLEEFPEEVIQSCQDAVFSQRSEETAGDHFVTLPPFLPDSSSVPITPDLVSAATFEVLYAYYAMLVFIMGKSLGPEIVTSISQRRPEALMRKRTLQSGGYLLIGAGQVKPANYRFVQSGWIRSTRPRMIVVEHLAKLNAAPNRSEILDSISVNMDMLRNSGQSYMFYIHELLVACPWCIQLPSLRSSYYHYARMVNVMKRQPGYLQPFFKLMMQDATKDVRRRDIEPLISVSTFFAAQTRKTMHQYRVNEGTLPVINAFRRLAESKGYHFEEVQHQLTTEVQAI